MSMNGIDYYSAMLIVSEIGEISRFGSPKKHGHNIAISHLANKMLVIIWHMLTEERRYRQRKETLYNKKLKKLGKIIQ